MGDTSERGDDSGLDESPARPSFLSRLALPLRSRTRNLADFHIQLVDPHRQYSAGDHVIGTVILSVVKPVRVTHLTVALHGFVRAYRNASAAAAAGPVNPSVISGESNRSFRYHGNGHASLFSDEQVLCGEGRLVVGKFKFNFDLIFPEKGLPSSIDFERGTISYMVTATLTRPTSISPTTTCETKVSLIEKVDIGGLSIPRPRTIIMQAITKRSKKKKPVNGAALERGPTNQGTSEPTSDSDANRARDSSLSNENSSVNLEDTSSTGQEPSRSMPRSPVMSDGRSEVSAESAASGGSTAGSRVSSSANKPISATVEVLKGGCLPGDLLSVKIHVQHRRRMKSLNGVIVTLYRQGRVDYAPLISSFDNLNAEDAERLRKEEFYPTSRTGLSGLSLTAAGSCSVFRKDLSQSVAPLIIDPVTLTADLTTSLRVPEDVFPSIRGVPGDILGFKYQVEVILDLGGRLGGHSQGTTQQASRMGVAAGNAGLAKNPYEASWNGPAGWNGTVINTDNVRREKGVISVAVEVVIGTVDSTRSRGKAVMPPALTTQPPPGEESEMDEGYGRYPQYDGYQTYGDIEEYPEEEEYQPSYAPEGYPAPSETTKMSQTLYSTPEPQAPAYIPPPQITHQNGLTEKERIQQAEQRLLPSQPQVPSDPRSEAGPSQPPSTPPHFTNGHIEASAPSMGDLQGHGEFATDDKQELERQRLLHEASAPPTMPEEYESAGPSAPPLDAASFSASHEPSAPILEEDDGYGNTDPFASVAGPSSTAHQHVSEDLPRYER